MTTMLVLLPALHTVLARLHLSRGSLLLHIYAYVSDDIEHSVVYMAYCIRRSHKTEHMVRMMQVCALQWHLVSQLQEVPVGHCRKCIWIL